METLHLRAERNTIEYLMSVINQISKDGQEIEIIDNGIYNKEYEMILKGLLEEKKEEVYEHNELWKEILN